MAADVGRLLVELEDLAGLQAETPPNHAEKIKTKIDWPRECWRVPVRPFLDAFYRAQRGSLEKRMLFG